MLWAWITSISDPTSGMCWNQEMRKVSIIFFFKKVKKKGGGVGVASELVMQCSKLSWMRHLEEKNPVTILTALCTIGEFFHD